MKVAVVTTRHGAKDDRIYYKEVLSLAKRYPNLTLVAPSSQDEELEFHDSVRFEPLKMRRGMVGRLLSIVDAVRTVRRLFPDVCHFHDYDLLLAVPFLKWFTHAKLVYDVHEFYPETSMDSSRFPRIARPLIEKMVRTVEERIARRCDLVVTPVKLLTERFERIVRRAVTIYNYPRLDFMDGNQNLSGSLGNDYLGRLIILYQGTMSRQRGLFEMIRAMSILKELNPEVLLVLLGEVDGVDRKQSNDLIAQLGLQGCIQFVPWVDHVKVFEYVKVAKIGLIPFLPVGQYIHAIPIKLFEYMGCGIPVLAADLPSVTPFIRESGGGRVYDSKSVHALAECIHGMLSDGEAWQRMSKNGFNAVHDRWNWGEMEKKLLAAYSALE